MGNAFIAKHSAVTNLPDRQIYPCCGGWEPEGQRLEIVVLCILAGMAILVLLTSTPFGLCNSKNLICQSGKALRIVYFTFPNN